ncbi:DMT family transporter [Paenibacillus xylaniclasticus]|uniref:DMT family transporter n=1 Tax=Paenibacillus xylaniclasticus TaxID=588083 RepID=UPI000FDBC3A7|nr:MULTISPECIES: DMT family transporter [Paenibacillus]GFN33154.1 membrane protein [Paenibacillus curdlanolyticus]
MNSKNLGYVWLAIAVFSFSSYEVISKFVQGFVDPTQLTFVRFLTGGLVLLPFAFMHMKKKGIRLTKKDLFILLLLGFLNVSISMNLIQIGMEYTPANLAAMIISSNPVFVALFSSIFLKERLTVKKAAGLLIGIVGVAVALGATTSTTNSDFYLGVALQAAGMIAFSLYTVLGKKVALRVGSITLNAYSSILGSLTILPFVLYKGISPFAIDLQPIWWEMAYICIGNTGLAFFLYFKALESLDTSFASTTFFVKPILASLLATLILGEMFSMNMVAGIVLVLIGIYFVNKQGQNRLQIRTKHRKAGERVG